MLGEDIPWFTGKRDRSHYELGAIDHRAATDGEQEIDLLATGEFNRLHQGFISRVGFNSCKLEDGVVFQRGFHFIQCAGLDDTATTVGDQYPGASRNLLRNISNAPLAE